MTRAEAFAILGLPLTANDHQVRAALFDGYEQLMQAQSDQTSWVKQLIQLNQARELVMTMADESTFLKTAASHRLPLGDLPPHLYILLYREDQAETVYALQEGERIWVLAFVNSFTARRYTHRLPAIPCWAERFPSSQLLEYCETHAYDLIVVPQEQIMPA